MTARTPASGATGVALGSDVTATFSRAGPAGDHRVRAAGARRSRRARHDVLRRDQPHGDARPDGGARRHDDLHSGRLAAPATRPATRWTRSRWTLHHRHAGHDQADGDRSHAGGRRDRGRARGLAHGDLQRGRCSRPRSPSRSAAPATRWCPPRRRTTPPAARPRSTRAPTSPRARPTRSTSVGRGTPRATRWTRCPGRSPRRPCVSDCPCTIWPSTATPAGTDGDTSSVELGVKFRSSTDGFITGIRYYQPARVHRHPRRQPLDADRHPTGPGTFTNEYGQRLAAGDLRHADPRHRRYDVRRLLLHAQPLRRQLRLLRHRRHHARPVDGPAERHRRRQWPLPLHLHAEHVPRPELQQRELLGRRRLRGRPDTTKPTVTARTPASGATGVSVGANVTATFTEPVQQSTLGLELRAPGGTLVAGATRTTPPPAPPPSTRRRTSTATTPTPRPSPACATPRAT